MINSVIESFIKSSLKLSSLGHQEQSALQEVAVELCGYVKLEGRDVIKVDQEFLEGMDRTEKSSQQIKDFFSVNDAKIGLSPDGYKAVLLYYIESEEMFPTMPMFLQNYFADGMFPSVVCIFAEKVGFSEKVAEEDKQFFALPYFSIINLSQDNPSPTLGFVGEENRMKVAKNPTEVVQDVMSNIHVYMPLIPAVMMKEA